MTQRGVRRPGGEDRSRRIPRGLVQHRATTRVAEVHPACVVGGHPEDPPFSRRDLIERASARVTAVDLSDLPAEGERTIGEQADRLGVIDPVEQDPDPSRIVRDRILHGENYRTLAIECQDPTIGPMGDYDGVRALVTGGASGIGLAVSKALSERGAHVAVLDRADAGPADFLFVRADVSDDDSVREAVGVVLSEFGGLDVLVNNAAVGATGGIADNPDAEWHRVLDITVFGRGRVTRAALPGLRASDRAAIVNVCSFAATVGLPQRAAYSASKGAVLTLTMAMAADLLEDGIRVNAVNPGTADTPWVGRLLAAAPDPEAERVALARRQPHGRLVSAEEVAHAVAYLASPLAGSTTGTWLAVDGGIDRLRPREHDQP